MIKCVGKAWLQSPPGGGGRAGSVRRGEHHGLPVAGAETAKLDGASCAHRARRRRDVRHVVGRDVRSPPMRPCSRRPSSDLVGEMVIFK